METPVAIRLKGDREVYSAGETLQGTLSWPPETGEPRAAELTVLWYTEGKGDMDFGVAYFQDVVLDSRGEIDFSAALPPVPLTYHGQLLKIHWVVRVRIPVSWGMDRFYEMPFTLTSASMAPGPAASRL